MSKLEGRENFFFFFNFNFSFWLKFLCKTAPNRLVTTDISASDVHPSTNGEAVSPTLCHE